MKKNMKKGNENSVIIIILAVLLVLVLAIVGIVVSKDNKALVKFDGGKVTKAEYEVYYLMLGQLMKAYGYDAASIPEEILDSATYYKVLAVEAKKAGVKLTDEDKAQLDEEFSDEEYMSQIEQMGVDLDMLKKVYEYEYLINNYAKTLQDQITDEEFINYLVGENGEDAANIDMYEYNTAHILFSFTDAEGNALSDGAKAELKTKAEGVLARAKNGEDFAALAAEFSDDSTASNGGKYTMYMDGTTVKEYADAASKLDEGEICATLVETQYGYHIIKLENKVENGRRNNENEMGYLTYGKLEEIYEAKTADMKIDMDAVLAFVKELDSDTYDAYMEAQEAKDAAVTEAPVSTEE